MQEIKVLEQVRSNFCVNSVFGFQDKQHLYLVLDLFTGGDMRYHIHKHKTFTEKQTKFFIACLLQALIGIHSEGLLHRDIKPENMILDTRGYLRLTDFGIAKTYLEENKTETSGTPGYMAPEVLFHKNHSIQADFFAIGIFGYECMMGKRPYMGRSREEIKKAIMEK